MNLFLYIHKTQANEADSSTGMEFLDFQKAFTFLLGTTIVIESFISNCYTSIAEWMREECPNKCSELGKPVIKHQFELLHKGKRKLHQRYMRNCMLSFKKTTLTKPITMASSVEQTSCLEGYYSVENQLAPKIIAFSYLGILSRNLDVPKKIITSDCVVYFLLFPIHRTILAALHFQSNLKRAAKLMIIGEPVLHVTYPKFKEGKATEKGPKVSSDYDYVADIYQTITTIPRAELKVLAKEFKREVPEPVHTMLADNKLKRMQWLNIRNAKKWRQ
ncbi:hypothetical protein P5673_030269 [Acropora cervicornis]|uniref:Uncharacterized protein n=1 Tax=Acropora cervicornis TaxID=6130 RepID=A0AAD9PUE4_ACRCE|nr:hypothetical protein P5673_030269 [Acropora cervicornis]